MITSNYKDIDLLFREMQEYTKKVNGEVVCSDDETSNPPTLGWLVISEKGSTVPDKLFQITMRRVRKCLENKYLEQ